MANDYEYKATLDDGDILTVLKSIDSKMDKFGRTGDEAFKKMGKSAKGFGTVLQGAVMGVVSSLTTQITNMVRNAGRELTEFAKDSAEKAKVQLATEAQTAQVLASTGNAAGMTAEQLKALAFQLQNVTNFSDEVTLSGENLLLTFTNIGRDVFPDATRTMLDMSVALKQDLKSSAIQLGKALNDPIKGITALQRDGVSFTESQKDTIQALVDTGRTADAQRLILAELQKEFGGSAEAARKADGGLIAFKNTLGDLQELFGTGILAGGSDFFEQLAQGGASDEMKALAEAAGVLAGVLIDAGKSELLQQLSDIDKQDIQQLADALLLLADSISKTSAIIPDLRLDETFSLLTNLVQVVTIINNLMTRFNEKFAFAGVFMKAMQDTIIGLLNPLAKVVQTYEQLAGVIEKITGKDITTSLEGLNETLKLPDTGEETITDRINKLRNDIASAEPVVIPFEPDEEGVSDTEDAIDSIEESLQKLSKAMADPAENADKIDDLVKKIRDAADGLYEEAEAAAKNARSLREMADEASHAGDYLKAVDLDEQARKAEASAEALEQQADAASKAAREAENLVKATDETTKALEKMAEIQKDYGRDVADIYKKYGRDLADLEEEIAQKRVDAARKSAQDVADIYRKNAQAVEDAIREQSQESQDIARKYARDQADAAQEASKSRLKIEQDYQRKLKDLRYGFENELADAEETQDALAYIAAVKKYERNVELAKRERETNKSTTEQEIADRQRQLEIQHQQELEDTRIANQRQMEELQIRLARELEEQNLNYQRELENIGIYEERKRAELKTSLERQLEDAAEKRDEKLEDLKNSLDDEVAAMVAAEEAKTQAAREGADARIAIAQEEAAAKKAANAGQSAPPPTQVGGNASLGPENPIAPQIDIPGMASGGWMQAAKPYLVGSNDQELFIPKTSGLLLSHPQTQRFLASPTYNTNNQQNVSYAPQFMLNNPALLTPEQQVMTQKIAENMAVTVSRKLMSSQFRFSKK